jgi:DNA-binding response OmpR family regulator
MSELVRWLTKPRVAIVNDNLQVLDLVCEALEDQGVATVRASVVNFRYGRASLERFLTDYRPHVVLWDIGIPYAANWEFFQSSVQARLPRLYCGCLITTTNKGALENVVGETEAIELIGQPFDLNALVQRVQGCLNRDKVAA